MLPANAQEARPGVPIFVELGGDNLEFYPNFALFSTLGGMNLDLYFVQASKLNEDQKKVFTKNGTLFSPNSGEDQKKRSSPNVEHFFSPYSSGHLRSDAHQSEIIRGDAYVDHTQAIGGIQSNYFRNTRQISPIPRVSAPLSTAYYCAFNPTSSIGLAFQKLFLFFGPLISFPSFLNIIISSSVLLEISIFRAWRCCLTAFIVSPTQS